MRSSTWSRSHRLGAALVGVVLAATAACAGGSDSSAPDSSAASTTSLVDEPPTSDAAPPATNEAPATTEAPATSTLPPGAEDDPDLPTIQDLRNLAFDGEITEVEFAVSHFAALFDVDIDGAIPARPDDTEPVDATDS